LKLNDSNARRFGRMFGTIGVVALASGGYAGLMQGFREWTTLVQIAIGVIGIGLFPWLYLPYLGQQFTGRGASSS